MGRNRSTGDGRHAFRAVVLPPAVDPPSPKVPRCLCCGFFEVASTDRTFPDSNGIPIIIQTPKLTATTKVGAPQKIKVCHGCSVDIFLQPITLIFPQLDYFG
ncbi:hypothetical protein MUK42_10397 [Musa troglodytarum]|uniref:Uncharacterized protein n=1 Tax=Musa troglodytarum TaxID=320322 RepID=A0A9E7GZI0_9LILI|nr:hypothetical protein MUK42_10397 [Musa troglodytarum]